MLSEDVHFSSDEEVEEGTDEHFWLVLYRLDVDDAAVDQLHHLAEHTVRVLI